MCVCVCVCVCKTLKNHNEIHLLTYLFSNIYFFLIGFTKKKNIYINIYMLPHGG